MKEFSIYLPMMLDSLAAFRSDGATVSRIVEFARKSVDEDWFAAASLRTEYMPESTNRPNDKRLLPKRRGGD
jgi:hypothetical protein